MTDAVKNHKAGPTPETSPLATGGSGPTFERRVAARYLATLITAGTVPELDGTHPVGRVAFQQRHVAPFDDIVVYAKAPDSVGHAITLCVEARRRPRFIRSDDQTATLITRGLQALSDHNDPNTDLRLAVPVLDEPTDAREVAELTVIARNQADASAFEAEFSVLGRRRRDLHNRLDHITAMVGEALKRLDQETSGRRMATATWQLLRHLYIPRLRIMPPDEADWHRIAHDLRPWTRDKSAAAGVTLLESLEACAAQYAPQGATVDALMLRRKLYQHLNLETRSNGPGWPLLRDLQRQLVHNTQHHIGIKPDNSLELPRQKATNDLRERFAASDSNLLIHGDSGVGKSSLVLRVLDKIANDAVDHQYVAFSLVDLPDSVAELRNALGADLGRLLSDLAAPHCYVFVDAADRALGSESHRRLLSYIALAAKASEVRLIVASRNHGLRTVEDALRCAAGLEKWEVPALGQDEIAEIRRVFPRQLGTGYTGRTRDLLRRPIVADLLVRANGDSLPRSESEAMWTVWQGLVRNHDRTDAGPPDARENTLIEIARYELLGRPSAHSLSLDSGVVDHLRHDSLLRSRSEHQWRRAPEFAHEQIRTYAVALALFHSPRIADALREYGVPRWSLPAARLGCQLAVDDAQSERRPRVFDRLQVDFDSLAAEGHGERWRDLPGEALLATGDPETTISAIWPSLVARSAFGLRRLIRIVRLRYRDGPFLRASVAGILTGILARKETPLLSTGDLADFVDEWLGSLIHLGEPAGHSTRLILREQLMGRIDEGFRAEERWHKTSRSPTSGHRFGPIPGRVHSTPPRSGSPLRTIGRSGDRTAPTEPGAVPKSRVRLPREVTSGRTIRRLGLLGNDLGEDGASLLRRVAAHASSFLEPIDKYPMVACGLASFSPRLLADLCLAYYIDHTSRPADGPLHLLDRGIRPHVGAGLPLAAWYRGAFLVLLRADFRCGFECIVNILDHAVDVHVGLCPKGVQTDSNAVKLSVDGSPRAYKGNVDVWLWHSGTSTGPYPCMSALQALEVVCREQIGQGEHLRDIVMYLMRGSRNLAIPSVVVRLLVEHLDKVDDLLDPFLASHLIWHFESCRAAQEDFGIKVRDSDRDASTRKWSFCEVATHLVITASAERRDRLREIGDAMTASAENDIRKSVSSQSGIQQELAPFRLWASTLDASSYRYEVRPEGLVIQAVPPQDVANILAERRRKADEGLTGIALANKYIGDLGLRGKLRCDIDCSEMASDLAQARQLPTRIGGADISFSLSAAAGIAATAIVRHAGAHGCVTNADFAWSADLLLRIATDTQYGDRSDTNYSPRSADRVTALGLPGLLVCKSGPRRVPSRREIMRAMMRLAVEGPVETGAFLACGLDSVVAAPCDARGKCRHILALDVARELTRGCAAGRWNPATRRYERRRLSKPVAVALQALGTDEVIVERLSPAIRAAGAVAASDACVRADARGLLEGLVETYARVAMAREHLHWHGDTDALVVARALLQQVAVGRDRLLFRLLSDLAGRTEELGALLRGLSASAEERKELADAARRVWPAVIAHVVKNGESRVWSRERYFDAEGLAWLMPSCTVDGRYLRRELDGDAERWIDVEAWQPAIEQWILAARGSPYCLDRLILTLQQECSTEQQAGIGLPWVYRIAEGIEGGGLLQAQTLPAWLDTVKAVATTGTLRTVWRRLADLLVHAGDLRAAHFAD